MEVASTEKEGSLRLVLLEYRHGHGPIPTTRWDVPSCASPLGWPPEADKCGDHISGCTVQRQDLPYWRGQTGKGWSYRGPVRLLTERASGHPEAVYQHPHHHRSRPDWPQPTFTILDIDGAHCHYRFDFMSMDHIGQSSREGLQY